MTRPNDGLEACPSATERHVGSAYSIRRYKGAIRRSDPLGESVLRGRVLGQTHFTRTWRPDMSIREPTVLVQGEPVAQQGSRAPLGWLHRAEAVRLLPGRAPAQGENRSSIELTYADL